MVLVVDVFAGIAPVLHARRHRRIPGFRSRIALQLKVSSSHMSREPVFRRLRSRLLRVHGVPGLPVPVGPWLLVARRKASGKPCPGGAFRVDACIVALHQMHLVVRDWDA